MNAYTTDTPHAAFAVAAIGLAALTLGTFVVGPAVLDASAPHATTLAARSKTPAPIEVTIDPGRIEVFGVREPNVAWALPHSEPCRPQV